MARTRKGDPLRAVGIVRTSTSRQDIGAAAQRAELERFVAEKGWELVAVFEDVGISGSAPMSDRPGLIAAIAALTEHDAGVLLAVKRDRFARCRFTIADVERAVRSAGGVLATTDGTCDGSDSETEQVSASIQDLVAQLELRKIRSRNKARAQRCIAEGRIHGRDVPFGMRRAAEGVVGRGGRVVTLEADPTEKATIETIRALHASGLSLRQIAAELGDHPRTGKPWQAMSISRILLKNRAS